MDNSAVERVLKAYSVGELSRSTAMELLGLDRYGDLLVLLNRHGIERPRVSAADCKVMEEALRTVFLPPASK
jgi:hypothetical protein